MIKLHITHKVVTAVAITALTIGVVGLSVAAIWKYHQHSVATVDKVSQVSAQRDQALQALANQEAVNTVLRSQVTTLTTDKQTTGTKLANLCALNVNKASVNCK